MSEIKEVTKYITSDGVEYSVLELAIEHQALINFKEDYGIGTTILCVWGRESGPTPLSDWILKNRGAVLQLLGYEE